MECNRSTGDNRLTRTPAIGNARYRIMGSRAVSILWSLKLTVATLAAAALYAAAASIWNWSFSSPLFLAILGVFTLNLTACTFRRLLFRPHRRLTDYLPDLAHVSLLILLVGGAGSLTGRREEAITLTTGEGFLLESRYELVLEETVNTGLNWESTFRVTETGTGTSVDNARRATTRVNSPLRLGRSTLYQTGWGIVPVITLAGSDGRLVNLSAGEGFSAGERSFIFEETRAGVTATELRGSEPVRRAPVSVGDHVGALRVAAIDRKPHTIITVVQDPGAVPAAIGGLLLTVSMAWFAVAQAFQKGDSV